jgi:hypothetical protein
MEDESMTDGPSSCASHVSQPWLRTSRAALASLVLTAGCRGAECVVSTTQYTTSVDALGYVGETAGKAVARFDLTQDFVSHTPYEACAQGPLQDVGAVHATLTNLTSTPFLIEFDVQGVNASGLMVWDHAARVSRVPANGTVDLGVVGVSPVPVDVGAKVVLTALTILPE